MPFVMLSGKFEIKHWWPVLLGPGAMGAVCAAYFAGYPSLYQKGLHETLGLVLLPLAEIGFLSCVLVYRCRIGIWFSVLTAALFCREWHFWGTSTGIKVALVVMGLWAYAWRDKLSVGKQLKVWTIATFATYFLSQFVARRGFRSLGLPLEKELQVPWEEVLETTAHLMLIVVSIIVWHSTRSGSAAEAGGSISDS